MRLVRCFLLLVLLLAPPTLQAAVLQPSLAPPQQASTEMPVQATQGMAGLLDAEGRLALPEGYIGSIDPAGFDMRLGGDGVPRFVAKGGAVDPDQRWDDGFALQQGCDGAVLAIVAGAAGELYLGGSFQSCGGVAANAVVRFDRVTETWSPLGSGSGNGVGGTVWALLHSGGNLYVGGTFTQANLGAAIPANRIARWNGSQWSALGSGGGNGVDSGVFALAVSGGDLFVGGEFSEANTGAGIPANRVARWNGSTWSALGSGGGNGTNDAVRALLVSGGDLYVGGSFTQANVGAAVPANRIARWNGSAWSALGSGGGNGVFGTVRALAGSGGDVYVGGAFTHVNWGASIVANHVARWNGSQWSTLESGGSSGVTGTVLAIALSGSDLYVGGFVTEANVGAGIPANRVAHWNGSTWSALGSGGGNGVSEQVEALAIVDGDLYMGGLFTGANVGAEIVANRIARWNGSDWSSLGGGEGSGASSPVFAMTVFDGDLYIGGRFTAVGGVVANRIARWSGGTWHALGSDGGNGLNGDVSALTVYMGDLYVGGFFTAANAGADISAPHIARWDGSVWSAVGSAGGNGVNGVVRDLLGSGSDLYVGGDFTQANSGNAISANRIVRWDGSAWSALGSGGGNGVSDMVQSLAVLGGHLYVGGSFTEANVGDEIPANRIARWTGSAWTALGSSGGNGVNATVNALAVMGGELYVGGSFTQANTGAGITVNRVARWNGSIWSALGAAGGAGLSSTVLALAVSGNDLFVGGSFLQANVGAPAVSTARVARWNGMAWTALGAGANGPVYWIQPTDLDTLYVGGDFRLVGRKLSSFVGRYSTRGSLDVALGGSGAGSVVSNPAGLNCPGACSARFGWDQTIVLTASANPGSVFTGWSGAGCSGTGPCAVQFDQEMLVSAEFEALTYTVGGNVSGLIGTGLVLRNNGGDDLEIAEDGSFTFATALVDGSDYDVDVLTAPGDPSQTCVLGKQTGTITSADVSNVSVTCSTDTYSVSATAFGNGSINPLMQLVEHGDAASFAVMPEAGHHLVSVTGTTCAPIDQGGGTWIAANINQACAVTASFSRDATDLQIAKSNGMDIALDQQVLVYAITVANAGPLAVSGAQLVDTLPVNLVDAEWACLPGESNTACPQPPYDAGSGGLYAEIDLPVGGFLRYDLSARVEAAAAVLVTNTATISTPDGIDEVDPSDNSATDTTLIGPDGIFANGFEVAARTLGLPAAAKAQREATGR